MQVWWGASWGLLAFIVFILLIIAICYWVWGYRGQHRGERILILREQARVGGRGEAEGTVTENLTPLLPPTPPV